jgi:hypothetical protein
MMKKSEIHKLKSWSALRGKKNISFMDVITIQPIAFWAVFVLLMAFGIFVFVEFGPHTLPFGVFIGGMASTLVYLSRIGRNIQVDLQYINWAAVSEALNGQAHKNV